MQLGTVLDEHHAVAVLVLQALARKRGPPRRSAAQEALAARIAERPDQIADALESEHRVVNEERNHLHAVIHVRRTRRRERRHRPCFGDSLFQNLPVLRFLVVQEHLRIVWFVKLALAGVNAELPEQRLHTERARLIRNNRHDVLAQIADASSAW